MVGTSASVWGEIADLCDRDVICGSVRADRRPYFTKEAIRDELELRGWLPPTWASTLSEPDEDEVLTHPLDRFKASHPQSETHYEECIRYAGKYHPRSTWSCQQLTASIRYASSRSAGRL